ncbi:hypothetical protein C7S16_6438 [Burkholderia thailandensis]|uniref:Uncharacterized protein n=1 Tax=Burkholderia thailandensis TaxID=57975 RepID=A0AAW9CMW4_BURTH|nr:hypothetical protein [Burkholderia thailandensis]MDW9250906.1 hypothetical protein [Burkholderia thailandensis]
MALRIRHRVMLQSSAEEKIVCPQDAAENPNASEIDDVSFQKSNRGALSSLLQADERVFVTLMVELVISGDIDNRHWPVSEKLYGVACSGDVASQYQYVDHVRVLYQGLAGELLGK